MRAGRISYPDIASDLAPFVNELVKHGFLHDGMKERNYIYWLALVTILLSIIFYR